MSSTSETTTGYPAAGVDAAFKKVGERADADTKQVDADREHAQTRAVTFGRALASGKAPHMAVEGIDLNRRYVSLALTWVYREWDRQRGREFPNPILPWRAGYESGVIAWKVVELLLDNLGEPVPFSEIKDRTVSGTGMFSSRVTPETMVRVLHKVESSVPGLVARKTKVDGKVAWLLRARHEQDPETPDTRSGWERHCVWMVL